MSKTVLTTLVLKQGVAVATLALARMSDGGYKFTDADGNIVHAHGNIDMTKLFDALAALE